jgi:hypothetical protein
MRNPPRLFDATEPITDSIEYWGDRIPFKKFHPVNGAAPLQNRGHCDDGVDRQGGVLEKAEEAVEPACLQERLDRQRGPMPRGGRSEGLVIRGVGIEQPEEEREELLRALAHGFGDQPGGGREERAGGIRPLEAREELDLEDSVSDARKVLRLEGNGRLLVRIAEGDAERELVLQNGREGREVVPGRGRGALLEVDDEEAREGLQFVAPHLPERARPDRL